TPRREPALRVARASSRAGQACPERSRRGRRSETIFSWSFVHAEERSQKSPRSRDALASTRDACATLHHRGEQSRIGYRLLAIGFPHHYGLGRGVGRGLCVGLGLPVGVGVGVPV